MRREREAEIQMREIKFRVWDKKEKKMYSPEDKYTCGLVILLDVLTEYGGCLDYSSEPEFDSFQWYNKEIVEKRYILMQFTGLKDKNGTEIYEGDIVIIGCYHLRAVIEYEHCGFVMHHVKGSKRRKYCANSRCEPIFLNCNISVEVIGNIYQNPELMEQKNG